MSDQIIREDQEGAGEVDEGREKGAWAMTDRDHFAAAALTGYNANPEWDDTDSSIVAEQAYADADAMLRERDRTHGGCPSGLDPEADRKSVASQRCRDTGGQPFDSAPTTTDWRSHIHPPDAADREAIRKCDEAWGTDVDAEPVAWIVHSGDLRWFAWAKPADGLYDGPIIPLYRTPRGDAEISRLRLQAAHAEVERLRLTDEEREAVACAAESYADNDDDEECAKVARTLRGLLERTGGRNG